jgi:hypothetical protein
MHLFHHGSMVIYFNFISSVEHKVAMTKEVAVIFRRRKERNQRGIDSWKD